MPTSSASLAQSAANVSITSSSSMSVTCAACCRLTFTITTRRERISRSTRIVRRADRYILPLLARLSRSHRSVGCIIATNGVLLNLLSRPNRYPGFGVRVCPVPQLPVQMQWRPKTHTRWPAHGCTQGSIWLKKNCRSHHRPSDVQAKHNFEQ